MTTDAAISGVVDAQVRAIALFFLLTLMDEKVALAAAHRTIAQMKALTGHGTPSAPSLIEALRRNFESHRKQLPRNRQALIEPTVDGSLVVPANVDFTAWKKFQRDASEAEIMALVLSKVLLFTDSDIAEGLNISLGTAKYRIGKGVRQLGASLS